MQILALVNGMLSEKGLMLKTGTVVDATLIAVPSSMKKGPGKRDSEMRPTFEGLNVTCLGDVGEHPQGTVCGVNSRSDRSIQQIGGVVGAPN